MPFLCDATWDLSTLTKMKSIIGILATLFSTSCQGSTLLAPLMLEAHNDTVEEDGEPSTDLAHAKAR